MSNLIRKDLHTPFNNGIIDKLLGHFNRAYHDQVSPADAAGSVMTNGVVAEEGNLYDAYVVTAVVCGAGESMSVDVLKNGTSILSAPLTIDADTPIKSQVKLPVLDDVKFLPGDIITCTRDYTAGGTATPMTATKVVVEFARGGKDKGGI